MEEVDEAAWRRARRERRRSAHNAQFESALASARVRSDSSAKLIYIYIGRDRYRRSFAGELRGLGRFSHVLSAQDRRAKWGEARPPVLRGLHRAGLQLLATLHRERQARCTCQLQRREGVAIL